ncbi:fasciclin domain-containing protein [Thalassotalea euphylliae]|uniref:Adhesin n=1 Tax=Thalassotalea euphylliae TaxID=1655234 RepID=A0A3E0UIG9_9GAMM|nr:fasciclin domain-containing protein [Thalassotalea euphylliae]REL35552.1 adhesin [Thalassotalea euphylliae]
MKASTLLITAFASLLFLQGCDDDDDRPNVVIPEPPAAEPNTVVDVAVADGNFTTLVAALQATGLDQTLDDATASFTVFAPTDAAFELLGQDTINALLADTDTLSDILTYHVIASEVDAAAAIASAGMKVEMVNGDQVGLSLSGDNLLVNTSTVTTTDIMTDNGIIHVIDAVLIPPSDPGMPTENIVDTAVAAGSFTTLVAALQATGLDATLSDESATFTVFAPTDDAFAILGSDVIATLLANPDVLSSILLQHVVAASVDSVTAYTLNGQSATTASEAMIDILINPDTDMLTVGGANVVMKDIYTTNGIIHVIDAVIVGDVEVPTPPGSIVEVAVGAGSFTTLVAALQATGLDTVLADTDTDFTVFAPSDAAFAKLGDATIAALLADPDTLSDILLYHVISGSEIKRDAALTVAQSADKKVTMANSDMAALSISGSDLFINDSVVSTADVMASNGVIHVIDSVILPPAMRGEPTQSIVDVAVADANFSTLVAALTAANLVSSLADENATFTVFAPTNDAFAKIESGVLSALLADTSALSAVLLKHVVSSQIGSVDAFAANGAMVETVGGDNVSVNLVNYASFTDSESEEVAYDAANQRLVGGMGSSMAGMSLYVFNNDLGSAGSNCNGDCATTWPPLLVTDGSVSDIPGVGTIMRDDGSMQASFLGRPLYFYSGDTAPGDTTGQGLGGVWFLAEQNQTTLQINGSNVIVKDIYTTNGVIHVIDTVITN